MKLSDKTKDELRVALRMIFDLACKTCEDAYRDGDKGQLLILIALCMQESKFQIGRGTISLRPVSVL